MLQLSNKTKQNKTKKHLSLEAPRRQMSMAGILVPGLSTQHIPPNGQFLLQRFLLGLLRPCQNCTSVWGSPCPILLLSSFTRVAFAHGLKSFPSSFFLFSLSQILSLNKPLAFLTSALSLVSRGSGPTQGFSKGWIICANYAGNGEKILIILISGPFRFFWGVICHHQEDGQRWAQTQLIATEAVTTSGVPILPSPWVKHMIQGLETRASGVLSQLQK